ncbi:MAG: di-heme oxidoredictase family protein [Bacteroidia bacterium]
MIKIKWFSITSLLCLLLVVSCRKFDAEYQDQDQEWLSGGMQTFFDASNGGFDHMFVGMDERQEQNHEVGDKAFDATFVTAPALINTGLGPLYNNVSCASCHVSDGRGAPPKPGEALSSMLFRLSIPGSNPHGGPNPVPGFGGQLQPRAIAGKSKEALVNISYTEIAGTYGDGSSFSLRKPEYTLTDPYMTLPANVMVSPRVAPPAFGLGLLEAISEGDLLINADEYDTNSDGISGKANRVWDVLSQSFTIGRFGWKAGQPSLIQQSAGAYNEDMGITNFVFPVENSFAQSQYDGLDDETELTDSLLHAVTFYMQTLGVPARRNVRDEIVKEGKRLFNAIGCASCHVAKQKTKVNVTFPALSNQTIFPYTDLLLHDMGEGLADNRPEFLADGYEWRTPALWGIGLTKKINGHTFFLHDGRARNLSEAILWHGGEGETSKEKYRNLTATERHAVLKFLESL